MNLEEKNIQHKITFKGISPEIILGSYDKYLSKLEKTFPNLLITIRDQYVKLQGPKTTINAFESVWNELLRVAKVQKKLSEHDLDIILTLHKTMNHTINHTLETSNDIITTKNKNNITARSLGQKKLIDAIKNNTVTFALGPAGTGKTFLSVVMAVKALKEGKVDKMVLTRPAVDAGETYGFLPGDIMEKASPYIRPLYDILIELLGKERVEKYLKIGKVEIVPLAYMRGRTLKNAYVILDEAQNTNYLQLKMFLTRMGENSKVIINGDPTQIDLVPSHKSGLNNIRNVLNNIDNITFVELSQQDIVRHPLVIKIIQSYEKYENEKPKHTK